MDSDCPGGRSATQFDTASQNKPVNKQTVKRILFFETPEFTGATRVTQTIAKKATSHFETKMAVVKDIENASQEINEAIAKEKPDILFSSFSSINPEVITVGKYNRLTVVVRQDYKLGDLTDAIKQRIFRTYTNVDWIIAQTPEMKLELLSYEALKDCRIKIIDNPLDKDIIFENAKAPNPFPNNGNFHFLWVGRKDPIKDLSTLQKAFEIVHREFSKTDLTIVSNESNPFKWMKNADCLVISSISEASPNVLREALLLGIKVVSTDCSPSVRKMLSPNMIAKVCDVEDLAAVMARAMSIKK